MIYKTAIDYAKEGKYKEIVNLLKKGPFGFNQKLIERNKKLHLQIQRMIRDKLNKNNNRGERTKENMQSKEEKTRQTEEKEELLKEVARLKNYLSLLKNKRTEIEFVNITDYEELSYIGEGGESSVKEVIKKEKYAKKELKEFSEEKARHFVGEGEILFKLRHPCIIDIFGFSYGDDSHPPSIILSLEPKSLESAISSNELSESDKNRIIVEVVLGMRYIHRRNFMHRDLKPSNILLSKKLHVRISDFGLAREDDMSSSKTRNIGTLRFMAPELFEEQVGGNYTNKVDVYSFGITLIYILTGRYPEFSMKNVVTGVTPKVTGKVASWVSDMIRRCLSPTAENRPSFNEILEEMKLHNYDMFSDDADNKLTTNQRSMKKAIEFRIQKIEAYEYQHRDD